MKTVLVVAISLLTPAAPVLADVVSDQTQQAAAISREMTANADQQQQALQSGTRTPETVAAGPSSASGGGLTASAQASAPGQGLDSGTVANPPSAPSDEPSVFSKIWAKIKAGGAAVKGFLVKAKDKVTGFVKNHPVITGAVVGAAIGAALCFMPGPVVVGALLGAAIGLGVSYLINKFKKS